MKYYRKIELPSAALVSFVGMTNTELCGWDGESDPSVGFREVDIPGEAITAERVITALMAREDARVRLHDMDRVSELGPEAVAAQLAESETLFIEQLQALDSDVSGVAYTSQVNQELLAAMETYLRGRDDHDSRVLLGRVRAHRGGR